MARCLLVEDDTYWSTHIQDILLAAAKTNKRYFHELVFDVACDAGKALAMLADKHYDLLITDLYFARREGYEMIKKIRETISDKDLPIIVVSVIADIDVKYPNIQAGATDIFEKPLRGDDLQRFITVVFNLIAGR